MPARADEPQGEIKVAPSAPLELMWLWHFTAFRDGQHGDLAEREPLRRRIGRRLVEFWGDGLPHYSTEMIVLAHRSNTLLDADLEGFFAGLETVASKVGRLPSLRSESAEEREAVRIRLERLASEPELRARYSELLRDLWKSVEGNWARKGRSAAADAVQSWSRSLAEGKSYREVLQLTRLWPERPELDEVADAAAAQGRLTLTPCWFGGKIHIIELDGDVYVGKGVSEDTSYRKVAARISSNLKALSDPTRLAILLRLARDPASVTELARQFEVSQPTISAHVQVLREAGLLEEKTVGRSAQLSASQEGLRRLFTDAEDSLIKAFRS